MRRTTFAAAVAAILTAFVPAAAAATTGHRVSLRDMDTPIPSFARQTGLPCSACHTSFPQLNDFGRAFKMNGYTLTGMQQVKSHGDSDGTLALDLIPPLSVMAQTSVTHVATTEPGTQNNTVLYPQELSLFVGGAITPRLGTFIQLTYSEQDGGIGFDNAEIRFADNSHLAGKPLTYGVTLNNNPTMQDVWNSTPAWGWPFAGSEVAPGPAAAPIITDALAQQVAGLGAYAFWNNLLYLELSGYRSAPQGGPAPVDGSASGIIKGVAPYWRLALAHDLGQAAVEVGTFGLHGRLYPDGVSGMTDGYTDIGFDAQVQRSMGSTNLTARTTWIHERRRLDASFAAGDAAAVDNGLSTWKADVSVVLPHHVGVSGGYFDTTGDGDAVLYAPGAVEGSATGTPDSNGLIGQVELNPWQNTRLALQYVAYQRFNGRSSNYDGAGRNASANNTLYAVAWLMF